MVLHGNGNCSLAALIQIKPDLPSHGHQTRIPASKKTALSQGELALSLLAALLVYIVVGLLAGVLAHLVMKGSALGLLCDVMAGCAGGLLGGMAMHFMGPDDQTAFMSIAAATVGGCVLIMIAGPLRARF